MSKRSRSCTIALLAAAAIMLGRPAGRALEVQTHDVLGGGDSALGALDWPARLALERTLAALQAAHQPRVEHGVTRLGAHGRVDRTGARLSLTQAGEIEVSVGLRALGRADAMRDAAGSAPEVAGPEVRIVRAPGVVEWWRSLPSGLEQGVTIAERPAGDGELVLEMTIGEGVHAELASEGAIVLRGADDQPLARYAHLAVLDAAGTRVPARLAVADGRIRIEVDDRDALYPLVVDPLLSVTETATLLASDGASNDQMGWSVSMSDDGTRALVSAYLDDTAGGTDAGSARVFVGSGATWTEERILVASDGAVDDWFGTAVAISGDGLRALVGAPYDEGGTGTDTGSARVFVRAGTTWAEEATLRAFDAADFDDFGVSVALSRDGLRAIVGATRDDIASGANAGSARVFLRTGTSWAEEATLAAADGANGDEFGFAVALNADASLAIVGASHDDTVTGGIDAGSARVYSRTGTTWSAEATLLGPSGAANDLFGYSVALSADGTRAIVGAQTDDTPAGLDAGSAHVFARSGTTWSTEATLLASSAAATDHFGDSVALSADGSRALVSAAVSNTAGVSTGTARLFQRTGTTWAEDATLAPLGGMSLDLFGISVALSADGSVALVGASGDSTAGGSAAGSARVFSIDGGRVRGAACVIDAECTSGFCIDGVCCQSLCGGRVATDCQACATALTGVAAGTCAPLTPAIAPTVTCRAGAGICDVAEVCTAASTTCPTNTLGPSGSVCRASAMACDREETCTGASAACPPDVPASAMTVCRAAADVCDLPEECSGTSFLCPTDARRPVGSPCRPSAPGGCDIPEACTGSSSACPADAVAAAGTTCSASIGPCDVPDVCTGTSRACPSVFAPATTVCGPAVTEPCDAPDHCTGTSADCVPELLAAVECRPATDACDLAETCTGAAAACPIDRVVAATVPCRTSTNPSCDPEETCDGVATACPADVIMCAPGPDSGAADGGTPRDAGGATDAGPAADAGSTTDAGLAADAGGTTDTGPAADAGGTIDAGPAADAGGGIPPVTSGCACGVGGAASTPSAVLVLALALALLLVQRRRAR